MKSEHVGNYSCFGTDGSKISFLGSSLLLFDQGCSLLMLLYFKS